MNKKPPRKRKCKVCDKETEGEYCKGNCGIIYGNRLRDKAERIIKENLEHEEKNIIICKEQHE